MKRILAFEGDGDLAGELAAAFREHGCALEVVDDAEAGLERATAERPDLILLSIELPRINGFSVCNRLKRNRTLRDIPLIILSSECSDETFRQHRTMQTRAEDYLRKPFPFEALLEKVRALLSLGAPSRAAASSAPVVRPAPPPLIIDDDARSGGHAPISAIVRSLDGAFDSIRELDEAPAPAARRPSQRPRSAQAAPAADECLLGLWSPDPRVRGRLFGFVRDARGAVAGRLSVGRETRNTIAVDDATIAEDHFLLERAAEGVFLRDLGSGKGTYVNEDRMERQRLHGGEVIRVGETSFLYLTGLAIGARYEAVVRELTELDPLTRMLTRRAFRERLEVEVVLAEQERMALSLAVVGIDDLRTVAYRYGDLAADEVIREAAAMLRGRAGASPFGRDLCDGFLVALPDTPERLAVALAEGWRSDAAAADVPTEGRAATFTLSSGVVERRSSWDATDLLRRGYRLLWEAQSAGGNRVVVSGGRG